MSEFNRQEHIEAMRRRLYERGRIEPKQPRHELEATAPEVTEVFEQPITYASPTRHDIADPRPAILNEPTLTVTASPVKKAGRKYRTLLLFVALGLFILVLLGTSLYMFFGTNQISNRNIGISVSGPLTTGAGEKLSLQAAVTNLNAVPIESATLIVNFPSGTRSVESPGEAMFETRIPVDRINAGEAINIPIEAIVFGEENEEQEIKLRLEYRLVDSNGTFYKDSDPFKYKISSSPVTLEIKHLKKVSSGQEIEIEIIARSNASNPLKNLLISAEYPDSFEYTSATPRPVYRENEWIIPELPAGQSASIKVKGYVEGLQSQSFQMQFSAGTAESDNQYIIGSVLANATADFELERPFLRLGLSINGEEGAAVVLPTGTHPNVTINVANSLSESLYDVRVEAELEGTVINREKVKVSNGFYDSAKNVITYDASGQSNFAELTPGANRTVTFALSEIVNTVTPSFRVKVNVYAQRVSDANATEELVGSVVSEVKFSGSATLMREAGHKPAPFGDTGPVPPVAEQKTTYTITLKATAGGNDITNATVRTSLPPYVNWENKTTGLGTFNFNPTNKELVWNIGTVSARASAEASFQVSFTPSQNQIGMTPALIEVQRLRATDKFTGTEIRADADPISTELSTEAGFPENSGEVRREVVESEDN